MLIRALGRVELVPTWHAMQAFTLARQADTPDELWLVEHPAVYTLGQAGLPEHLLQDVGIPVVKIDRGGQITYHGHGQVVVYLMLDLNRRKLKVKELVSCIEQAIINLLVGYGIPAARRERAPGVYVGEAKIAALGLKVKNGCTYHGLALNVAMDLTPFAAINPCGYAGLAVTQLSDLGINPTLDEVGKALISQLTVLLEEYSHA